MTFFKIKYWSWKRSLIDFWNFQNKYNFKLTLLQKNDYGVIIKNQTFTFLLIYNANQKTLGFGCEKEFQIFFVLTQIDLFACYMYCVNRSALKVL